MPFIAVLLLKLKGWTDHRNAKRKDYQKKQYVDVDDIREMLRIWFRRQYRTEMNLRTESWIPLWFVDAARQNVDKFVEAFPSTSIYWFAMGFDVDIDLQS